MDEVFDRFLGVFDDEGLKDPDDVVHIGSGILFVHALENMFNYAIFKLKKKKATNNLCCISLQSDQILHILLLGQN